jgi:hypothetical protein
MTTQSPQQADELTSFESRLQQKNLNDPLEAIEVYFSDISLTITRRHLWELYRGWVMSERATNCDPKLPGNLIFFYTHLEMLAEAAWMLRNRQRARKKKK